MGKRGAVVALVFACVAAGACSSTSSSKGIDTTTVPDGATETSTSSAGVPSGGESGAPEPTSPPASADLGDLVVGLDSEPPTLDPAANSLSLANGSVYAAIYETLFVATPTDPFEPLLATEITPNADFTTWTLRLREGVTFQDGTPFDAEAVIFNLNRQKASLYNGSSLGPMKQAVKVDDLTVEIQLNQSWVALPSLLTGIVGVMVSPAAASAGGFDRNPVGTGPYRFVEWQAGQELVVQRHDTYWGESKAPLNSITFRFIPLETTRVAAFGAGEIDAFTTIIDDTAEQAKADGAQVIAPPPTGFGFTLLNTSKAPLDDPRVRLALEIGYDRDAIASAYQGQGYADASYSPLLRTSEFWLPVEGTPTYDPERAKQLLKEYGKPVKFTFRLLKGSQLIEDAVRATIEFWNDLGMDVTLELSNDLSSYVVATVTGGYDAVGWLGGSLGDPDSVFYNTFHSTGAGNYMRYSNQAVDAALDEARSNPDPAARKAAYEVVQAELRKDQPVLISSHGQIYIVASAKVAGLDPVFFFPSRSVRLAD